VDHLLPVPILLLVRILLLLVLIHLLLARTHLLVELLLQHILP
jgi:hypothetical protein